MKLSTIYFGAIVVEGYDDTRVQELEDEKLENWDSLNSLETNCEIIKQKLLFFEFQTVKDVETF